MNLQMTTTQKVVAAFIGMVILTIGLGIVVNLVSHHQDANRACTTNSSQPSLLRDDGITPIADSMCVAPQNSRQ